MVSTGVNIDCNYMIQVKNYIPVLLPRPRKKPKLYDCDGGEIRIITVTIGALE